METLQLTALVAEWQGRLRLREWMIGVEGVDAEGLGGGDYGRITYQVNTLQAVLRVATRRSESAITATVIHELGHLLLAPLDETMQRALKRLSPDEAEAYRGIVGDLEEQVCERLSRGLSGDLEVSWCTAD